MWVRTQILEDGGSLWRRATEIEELNAFIAQIPVHLLNLSEFEIAYLKARLGEKYGTGEAKTWG